MSGILGRIELSGRPVDKRQFKSALDKLADYGPDGRGVFVEGPVAFGFQFMRIARREVDEEQPVRSGSLTLVADAILDNRGDLGRALGMPANESKLISDSALILRAYRKWGEDCTEHLLGDYAFAVHDADRHTLLLVRDHIGARPLYWARRNGTILFGSDIRGLISFDDHEWRIDETIVADYLSNPFSPVGASFFAGIESLEPGHSAKLTKSESEVARWWDPGRAKDVRYRNHDDYVSHLRELLEASIAHCVDTDKNVGSHISGGIDSTTIAVLASKELAKRGRNLTAGYAWAPDFSDDYPDMGPLDERRTIAEICSRFEIPIKFGSSGPEDFLALIQRPFELEGKADLLDEFQVLERAGEDKIGVMLSGWGGDEAYSAHGLGYVAYLLKHGRFVEAVRIARRMNNGRRNPRVLAKWMWPNGILPLFPDWLYDRFEIYENTIPDQCFISTELRLQSESAGRTARPRVRMVSDPRAYLRSLLFAGHIGERMLTWASWGAGKGVIYRYPLTDRRLLEYVTGLPPKMHYYDGKSRYMSRAAIAEFFPETLDKLDPANEKLRFDNRAKSWRLLAQQLESGAFDGPCRWLDMQVFRQRLTESPNDGDVKKLLEFYQVLIAARVYALYGRGNDS